MLREGAVVNDRYEVLSLLGEGGLAQVWRVRHLELGSEHALKVLIFRRQRLADRLLLEGRIQAQLKHPNVVAVTDVLRFDGQVGLLMEFVDGVSLDHYLDRKGQLDLDAALDLFASVLAGVRAAHSAGVLHRDLKPANILLARGPTGVVPKVADFGIAKVVEGETDLHATRVGAMMGTPAYLAPEQASDASGIDQRADIFALGAILYEVLTGVRAFPNAEPGHPETMVAASLSQQRAGLPEHVVRATHRAMAVAPDDRYASIDAFAAELYRDHPRLVQRVVGQGEALPAPLSLSLPSKTPATTPRETPTALPAPPTSQTLVAPSDEAEPTTRWILGAAAALFGLVGVALWLGSGGPPAQVVQAPQELLTTPSPSPTPSAAPAGSELVTSPAAVATPTVTPPPTQPTPVSGAKAPSTPAPAVASPVPTPNEPAPATPPIVTATPAPTDDALAIVTAPTPTPRPTPTAPTTPASLPEVRGVWNGSAAGKPVRLHVVSQDGARLSGELVFTLGPTQRSHALIGSISADGTLSMSEVEGTLLVRARISGRTLTGTYQRGGDGKPQDWSAKWESR
jgi:serine/threonine protein kinase